MGKFFVSSFEKVMFDKTYFGPKYVTWLQNLAHFRANGPTPRSMSDKTYLEKQHAKII